MTTISNLVTCILFFLASSPAVVYFWVWNFALVMLHEDSVLLLCCIVSTMFWIFVKYGQSVIFL